MDKKVFITMLNNAAAACPKFAPDFSKPGQLSVWYEDLKDVPEAQLSAALAFARQNLDEFPSIAWIRRHARGNVLTDDQVGIDVARRIEESLARFGWTNPGKAQEYIGPIGWQVVQGHGGWVTLCQCEFDDLISLRKAWREQAVALYKKQAARGEDYRIELPPNAQTVAAQYLERAKRGE